MAVSADVVEAVVVNARVADVRCRQSHRLAAPQWQKLRLIRGVELQKGRADLKSLRPLRPTARRISSSDGEDWRPFGGVITAFNGANLLGGQLPQAADLSRQIGWPDVRVDLH